METTTLTIQRYIPFRCSINGETRNLDLSTLSPDYIAKIIAACQVATDAMAKADKKSTRGMSNAAIAELKVGYWQDAFTKLANGQHQFGKGGGPRRTVNEDAFRQVIIAVAKKLGYKGDDLAELVKTPKTAAAQLAEAYEAFHDQPCTEEAMQEILETEAEKLAETLRASRELLTGIKINI